ncbi:DUF1146 domain-containing protein [Lysinibacillus fusiformis]|jgi:uncharacterized integral membrane protein (TIGR02327 family)|uniref:Conserved hypothetical integral membrane protein n=1 Tax=Lysinibacillus fusiformis TaxID=28031 RepID=A0A1E4R2Q7_9BACI|nr:MULTISPECIES: DUF1146 family protein [Bacillales]EAZ83928.1 hypothetical protein BB14905_19250 [Bacillus sp. B14905]AJK89429.1 membrane protein [Lysinibacillus fusiformis]KAB0441228.1 DUF1146 domain-containing protein [Lysinibacillus fusiformis]KEK11993.1 membrane protein [Lysinibacillus sphaericus]KGA85117.1 membrane protein [Lysinibacillus fusiformis]
MELYEAIGQEALLGILSHLFFIAITFYALQAFMTEKLFKKNRVFQIQLIYILLSITIGSAVSNFFLQISNWSGKLPYLF